MKAVLAGGQGVHIQDEDPPKQPGLRHLEFSTEMNKAPMTVILEASHVSEKTSDEVFTKTKLRRQKEG